MPEGVSPDWFSEVKKKIKEEEYLIYPLENGKFTAQNRANSFKAVFEGRKIEIYPLNDDKWNLSLELITNEKENAHFEMEENLIKIYRGKIIEWYVNEEKGLKQGFDILEPFGKNKGRLEIDIKFSGNLHPKFSEDGQAVVFYNDENLSCLNYSQLKVFDALGKELPSHFVGIPNGVRISINTEKAVLPIKVDPYLTGPVWIGRGEIPFDDYGATFSTAGDVNGDGYSDVVIGAWTHNAGGISRGRVYVYLGRPSGLYAVPSWIGSGEMDDLRFGFKVGIAGDVNGDGFSDILVGTPNLGGYVYLYLGTPSGPSAA